jgi:hypothetical protein
MRRRLSAPSSGRAGFAGTSVCVANPKRRPEDGTA